MHKEHILARYDKDLRIHINYPDARKEVSGEIVRFVRQAPGMNFVGFTFARESQLEAVIAQQVDYFAPRRQPLTWTVYQHDVPLGLEHKLLRHGFVEADSEAVMILDVQNQVTGRWEAGAVDMRQVTDRAGLEDIVHVLDGVYGNNNAWVYARLGLHLQIPGYLSAYVAYVEAQPAAVAWTYFPKGQFATLFAGSTLTEFRNRGLYTSLLARRVHEIRQRGYRFAVVEAGPMSKPIVAKYGFQHLTTACDFVWQGEN